MFVVCSQIIELHDLNTAECLKTFLDHTGLILDIKHLNENQIITCSKTIQSKYGI